MTTPRSDWLPLEEAARRLGVSRLRLREAIAAGALAGRRDNRGFWRVDLGGDLSALRVKASQARAAPDRLVEALFDEIEEITALLGERDADIERLGALVVRQNDMIERTMRFAEGAAGAEDGAERLRRLNERSQALIEQALGRLERQNASIERMAELTGRAMGAVEAYDAELQMKSEHARRQQALMERVLAAAQGAMARLAGERRPGFLKRLLGRGEGSANP